jgi:hypothetical protein
MIVREPETNTEAPLLGKEGATMLELWKAQMDWLSSTGQLTPAPTIQDPEKKPTPEPEPLDH